jgi:hypothetical protein
VTGAPAAIEVIDGIPCGWTLGRESWIAHRMFYCQTGRPMAFREYSRLLRAQGAGAERLSKQLGVWRVIAAEGEIVIVQRSGNHLRQILPADWTAPPLSPPILAQQPQPKAQTPANPSSAPAFPRAPAQPTRAKLTPRELRARLGLPVA